MILKDETHTNFQIVIHFFTTNSLLKDNRMDVNKIAFIIQKEQPNL